MSRLYDETHRALQEEFDSRALADAVEAATLKSELDNRDGSFIAARDMFFLSTVNAAGQPTVSYKGGDPGFVKVVNPTTLVFPSYDGNGMFLSMGNIDARALVGMLFIDLEHPNRLRLHGRASLHRSHPLAITYPEAELIIEVAVTEVWTNCPRYVHRYEKIQPSAFVPREAAETPLAPWKRIDQIQPVLKASDQVSARAAGLITAEDYQAMVDAD
ncbi:MAG TPA: pyridoxamine 5'-phosphate oxidase family protein [Pseudomonadales bacterium]